MATGNSVAISAWSWDLFEWWCHHKKGKISSSVRPGCFSPYAKRRGEMCEGF